MGSGQGLHSRAAPLVSAARCRGPIDSPKRAQRGRARIRHERGLSNVGQETTFAGSWAVPILGPHRMMNRELATSPAHTALCENRSSGSGALSNAEYRALVEHSPVMIWRSGLDTRCDYLNETWLAFTGRMLQQEVGEGWAEGIHPDDVERCVNLYLDCFQARKGFEMEYR